MDGLRRNCWTTWPEWATGDPITTDIKYYNLLKAWKLKDESDFTFVNSHDKTAAVRDSSKRETLERALKTRLNNSKNVLLILGPSTARDTDWVPFEIRYAVDTCRIPIIAAYIDYERVQGPAELRHLWPAALATRIDDGTASVIHVPFKQAPIADAIFQFGPDDFPKGGGLGYYSTDTYRSWGLL